MKEIHITRALLIGNVIGAAFAFSQGWYLIGMLNTAAVGIMLMCCES